MANEIRYYSTQSGLTLTAKVFNGPSQIGGDIALTETAGVGYFGDLDLSGFADGVYNTVFYNGSNQIGGATLYTVDGAEALPGTQEAKVHGALDSYSNKSDYQGSGGGGGGEMAIISELARVELPKVTWIDVSVNFVSGSKYRFTSYGQNDLRFTINSTAPSSKTGGTKLPDGMAIQFNGTKVWMLSDTGVTVTPIEVG